MVVTALERFIHKFQWPVLALASSKEYARYGPSSYATIN